MSHTLNPFASKPERSELAVQASNKAMIDKATESTADLVFLDLEDAVAPRKRSVYAKTRSRR